MADPKYTKSTTGQLIGQAIKELGLSVADYANHGSSPVGNAARDVKVRSNDVSRSDVGDEYRNRAPVQNAGDDDNDASSEPDADEDDAPKKKVRTVYK